MGAAKKRNERGREGEAEKKESHENKKKLSTLNIKQKWTNAKWAGKKRSLSVRKTLEVVKSFPTVVAFEFVALFLKDSTKAYAV